MSQAPKILRLTEELRDSTKQGSFLLFHKLERREGIEIGATISKSLRPGRGNCLVAKADEHCAQSYGSGSWGIIAARAGQGM